MKKAIITGISGQDGAWLSDILIKDGIEVWGGARNKNFDTWRLELLGIKNKINLFEFDLSNQKSIEEAIQKIKPDYLYNLGAQSSVIRAYNESVMTLQVNGISVVYMLESLKKHSPDCKFFQAGSTEMFGVSGEILKDEDSAMAPVNPYGASKLFAYIITKQYNKDSIIKTINGILFNHESELRGKEYLTRKVSSYVANYSKSSKYVLEVGNLNSERDWGYAKEYVQAMKLCLETETEFDSFIIASGKKTKVRDFIRYCFEVINIEIHWEGEAETEIGINKKTGEVLVRVNPDFFRPYDFGYTGDISRIRSLGWEPRTSVQKLAETMVNSDLQFVL